MFLESADMLQKLSLDSQAKASEIPEPNKKVWSGKVLSFTMCVCLLVFFFL